MKLGLIGLQNSGKTTIFNALTKLNAEVTQYATAKAEPNLAIVDVEDSRVLELTKIYSPKKTVFATIEMMDFVGLTKDSAKEGSFSGEMMNAIKNMDALALVVRNFTDDLNGEPDPLSDIEQIDVEMLLFDLIFVENRIERIEHTIKRGKKTTELEFEEKVMRKLLDQLNANLPIRDLDLNDDEEKIIRGYQFFTKKPFMVILNSDESIFGKNEKLMAEIEKKHKVIEFAGKFEMELSRLTDEDEVQMFMEDMGIKESARARLTKFAYDTLGYISFFTVGSDEVRAWNIHEGDNAVKAAGAIHTDLARGFIRAECFTYNDLIEKGSESEIKKGGRFRLEGKDYIVQDGDILSIRFNV